MCGVWWDVSVRVRVVYVGVGVYVCGGVCVRVVCVGVGGVCVWGCMGGEGFSG